MVDNAITVEHAHKEMGEYKRKFDSQGQSSNKSHPYFVPPQGHLSALEVRMSTSGRTSINAPTSITSRCSTLAN
jgi:hypothetical protein